MNIFIRADGQEIRIIRGLRKQILSSRRSLTPKKHWSEEDYLYSAEKKINRSRRLINKMSYWRGTLNDTEILEVGCGDGVAAILLALEPVRRVIGIDRNLPLFDPGEIGQQARNLMYAVFKKLGMSGNIYKILDGLPVKFLQMDASRMAFPDNTFDILTSNSVMEHMNPIEGALDEMARVVRPHGLIYHSIDPFYWLKGCHKKGVVDIPWAHSRLSIEEFRRYVNESEGKANADKRIACLESLNRFTLKEWRNVLEGGPFHFLEWREVPNLFAQALLDDYPEVTVSLLRGVEARELVQGRLEAWLRNNDKI